MDKSLAPGFARITYDGATGVHHAVVPVNLKAGWVSGVEPLITLKDASDVLAEDVIGDYVDAWKGMLMNSQNIGLCEVYAVDPDTGEGTFVYGFDLNTTGDLVGAGLAYRSVILTYKLTNGRTARVYVLENNYPVDEVVIPPYTVASPERIFSDYLKSDFSAYYGRGNAYPFAPISLHTKTFDPLRTRAGL